MTTRAKEQLDTGMTWFWRASVVTLLGVCVSTFGYFGTKLVDKATTMSSDINQIKVSIGEQQIVNGNQALQNGEFSRRITKLEK